MKAGVCLLLLVVTALLQLCAGTGAGFDCNGVDGFSTPPDGQSSYVTYSYTVDATGECDSVMQNCFATVTNTDLNNRIWYLEPTRPYFGFAYKSNWIQIYNVQCPDNTVLHLFPLFLETEAGGDAVCTTGDVVTVEAGSNFFEVMCGNDNDRIVTNLYNDGVGQAFVEGNATITFCSNGNDVSGDQQGFVIRAMCINPSLGFLDGCTNYQELKETDPDVNFVDRIFDPYLDPVKTILPHKRSADRKKAAKKSLEEAAVTWETLKEEIRQKRSELDTLLFIDLAEGQFAEYDTTTGILTVDYNNGTTATFDVNWLAAFSQTLGTRIYDLGGTEVPAGLTFTGPGSINVFGKNAFISYTISDEDLINMLFQNTEITDVINMITNYTYFNYVDPYPIICPRPEDAAEFPLPIVDPDDTTVDSGYLNVNFLDFIQPNIENGTCARAIRTPSAPATSSFIESNIDAFCRHFYYSCDSALRLVCQEIDRLL